MAQVEDIPARSRRRRPYVPQDIVDAPSAVAYARGVRPFVNTVLQILGGKVEGAFMSVGWGHPDAEGLRTASAELRSMAGAAENLVSLLRAVADRLDLVVDSMDATKREPSAGRRRTRKSAGGTNRN